MSRMTQKVESTAGAEALLTRLVENGDLERITQLARLVSSAGDAMTDEMVSRLAGVTTEGLDLLDRVNGSGIAKALPALTRLVENGDLERITQLARLASSAGDAMTDEMVSRLAGVVSEGVFLLDRFTRSEGILRMLGILEREDVQQAFSTFVEAVCAARADTYKRQASPGGYMEMFKLVRDPKTQDAMRFVVNIAAHLAK